VPLPIFPFSLDAFVSWKVEQPQKSRCSDVLLSKTSFGGVFSPRFSDSYRTGYFDQRVPFPLPVPLRFSQFQYLRPPELPFFP